MHTHTHKGRGNWSTRRNTLMSNPVNKCHFQKKMSTEVQTHNIWFSVVVTSALATALQTAPNIYIYFSYLFSYTYTVYSLDGNKIFFIQILNSLQSFRLCPWIWMFKLPPYQSLWFCQVDTFIKLFLDLLYWKYK